MSGQKLPARLLALSLSAFAIGTTKFVIMGLRPQVAQSLTVSIPKAGWLLRAMRWAFVSAGRSWLCSPRNCRHATR